MNQAAQNFASGMSAIFGLIFMAIAAVIQGLAKILRKTGIARLIPTPVKTLFGNDYTSRMLTASDARYAKSGSAMVRGDLFEAAKTKYPPAAYPELFEDVPDDLVRPIISDGRLITGERISALAPRRISFDTVSKLYDAKARQAEDSILFSSVVAVIVASIVGLSAGAATQASFGASQSQAIEQTSKSDIWESADIAKAQSSAKTKAQLMSAARMSTATVVGAISWVLVFALIFGIAWLVLARMISRPKCISGGIDTLINSDETLTKESKEEIVRWKYRQDDRAVERRSYREQLVAAKADTSPAIQIGFGTGVMLYRGCLQGLMMGQRCIMTIKDFAQNLLILGGTGQGKTFAVLLPICAQWIALQMARAAGAPTMALFASDGKGVLWRDIMGLALSMGIPKSKIRVIGCGVDEYGVDLVDGLPPHILAEALTQVMTQLSAGGGNSDPFWATMAGRVIEASATIAHAAEVTNAGLKYIARTGGRLYSPAGIYEIAMSNPTNSLLAEMVDGIVEAFDKSDTRQDIAANSTTGLVSAIKFMMVQVPGMADATRTSILANVTNTLGGFTALPILTAKFGAASATNILNIDTIFDDGNITLVNLSPTEYGAAGRLANIMTKLRLYHRARVRNIKDPLVGDTSKVMVMMDECQDLITAGAGGYAETTFLNYSRSTGLSFVMATQGIPALRAALGEASNGQKTENLVQQLRSKIVIQIEDLDTLRYLQGLFGKTLRAYPDDHENHESLAAAQMERNGTLYDFDCVTPYSINDDDADRLALNQEPGFVGAQRQSLYKTDWQYYAADISGGGAQSPTVDWTEKLKSVMHRAEDKRIDTIRHGWHEESLVHDSDMAALGRGQAFVYIKRAVHSVMDIVTLTPNVGNEYIQAQEAVK
jgi:hypothetical protein